MAARGYKRSESCWKRTLLSETSPSLDTPTHLKMNACCAVLLGLIAVAAAHWDGYPFVPKNEGKYGAAHPYANYGSKAAAKQPGYGYGQVNAGYGLNAGYGYPYGQYGGNDYAHNHEYDFRRYGGFPVHVGAGRFQFLGSYGGKYFIIESVVNHTIHLLIPWCFPVPGDGAKVLGCLASSVSVCLHSALSKRSWIAGTLHRRRIYCPSKYL